MAVFDVFLKFQTYTSKTLICEAVVGFIFDVYCRQTS